MKLIVGLGNPGKEYINTRHNIGFMIIDEYAKINDVVINNSKFNGLYTTFVQDGEKVMLLKPQKYMNLSGEVIKEYVDYFNIDISDILIISDDLDMVFGKYRLRQTGSSGGHNGLKNIENHLKTKDYKRLKFGISNNKDIDTKDYVLGKIKKEDLVLLNNEMKTLMNILEDFSKIDFNSLMNKYNKNI